MFDDYDNLFSLHNIIHTFIDSQQRNFQQVNFSVKLESKNAICMSLFVDDHLKLNYQVPGLEMAV